MKKMKGKRSFIFVIRDMNIWGSGKMSETQNLNQIMEKIEKMKQELDELKNQLMNLRYEGDIEKLFSELEKIVNDNRVRSVIFVDSDSVKYISRDNSTDAYRNLLIIGNKLYNWNDYKIDDFVMKIMYSDDYEVPNEIVNLIQRLPESGAEHLEPYYYNFYHALKNKRIINLIKG